mgnify:CR=1 FL=1
MKPKHRFLLTEMFGLKVTHCIPEKKLFSITLLLFPGLWCDNRVWREFQGFVADLGFETIAVSSIDGTCTGLNIIGLENRVMLFVKSFKEECILVCHSATALVSMDFLGKGACPNVKGFVSVTAATPFGMLLGWEANKRLPAYLVDMFAGRDFGLSRPHAYDMMFTGMSKVTCAGLFPRLITAPGKVARDIALGKIKAPRHPLAIPVLCISTENDVVVPTDRQEKIAHLLGGRHVCIKGEPHMVTMSSSGSQKLAKEITNWLRTKFTLQYAVGYRTILRKKSSTFRPKPGDGLQMRLGGIIQN